MELQLKIIGILLILLAAMHAFFPKYFKWKEELQQLSLINRQMMEVHTLFIALVLLLMGLLCLMAADELLTTKLGKIILTGIGLFWAVRLVVQFFVYSPLLWRDKKFETTVHIIFSLLWSYLTVFFLAAALYR
jgi:hypothetical protein